MNKKAFQLRNYHLRRGKDKDSTPIYPITTTKNIIHESSSSSTSSTSNSGSSSDSGNSGNSSSDSLKGASLYDLIEQGKIGGNGNIVNMGEGSDPFFLGPLLEKYSISQNTPEFLDENYLIKDGATFIFDSKYPDWDGNGSAPIEPPGGWSRGAKSSPAVDENVYPLSSIYEPFARTSIYSIGYRIYTKFLGIHGADLQEICEECFQNDVTSVIGWYLIQMFDKEQFSIMDWVYEQGIDDSTIDTEEENKEVFRRWFNEYFIPKYNKKIEFKAFDLHQRLGTSGVSRPMCVWVGNPDDDDMLGKYQPCAHGCIYDVTISLKITDADFDAIGSQDMANAFGFTYSMMVKQEPISYDTTYYFPDYGLSIAFDKVPGFQAGEDDEPEEVNLYAPRIVNVETKEVVVIDTDMTYIPAIEPKPNENLAICLKDDDIVFDFSNYIYIPGIRQIDCCGKIKTGQNSSLSFGYTIYNPASQYFPNFNDSPSEPYLEVYPVTDTIEELEGNRIYEYHIFEGAFSIIDMMTSGHDVDPGSLQY